MLRVLGREVEHRLEDVPLSLDVQALAGLPRDGDVGMIRELLTHADEIADDRYPGGLELGTRADPRERQQVRRLDGARRDHDLLGFEKPNHAISLDLESDRSRALESDPSS